MLLPKLIIICCGLGPREQTWVKFKPKYNNVHARKLLLVNRHTNREDVIPNSKGQQSVQIWHILNCLLITATLHELKYPVTGIFVRQLAQVSTKQSFALLVLCEGNPLVPGGYLLERSSYAESVPISWYYNVFRVWPILNICGACIVWDSRLHLYFIISIFICFSPVFNLTCIFQHNGDIPRPN